MGSGGQAQCVDDNPCENVSCEHGCVFGLCLQGPGARGEDADGDGFSELADCDDHDPNVHPAATESCDNGRDDNCSGFVDDCGETTNFGGGGPGAGPPAGNDGNDADDEINRPDHYGAQCICTLIGAASPGPRAAWLLLAIAFGVAWGRRRRRT
ncbi:MAG: putative metal-binding motif-containing protein [Deltaproteobacteria bacterium]|nr:putative metal-binding motif-containing protein [Deltaproteobacteria bacterium]MBW2537705.1 putative metal-binding motif-containing protein [Deltaproteobacteria bacterium]